jgi:cytoskeletal protein CcmA (bactofilin family)
MFKGNSKTANATSKETKITFIAEGIEVSGNIKGKGAVQIEGTLDGDISVTSVVIGENGTVNGMINSTNVIINGKLNGSVFCDSLEIMPNGNVSNEIKVKQVLISGKVDGSIESKEEINIDNTGIVNATTMKSKNIVVNGAFTGKVTASELLEIGTNGSVEGEIIVKNIKTHEGGKLLGSMQNYVAEKKPEIKKEEQSPKA